ncbi:GYD domain-containing protein [Ruegeria sediminis]|uniref:GYD domain-containing protein n=1 Tax=Ruegeria sediminis TaxID=2583820 RepID=A0ABY2WY87_9RHOB|nr:GYD domain-containing protein [Ruegeria sediminis]TMV07828.1 GYD domain-containing protein [Ruegeria sediminis]
MPLFITYASYSQNGIKGLLKKPENRAEAIQSLLSKVGGKVVALYMTTGANDVVLVSEAPDGADTVAVGMAVAASGSVTKVETVRAWTGDEFAGIAQKAASLTGAYKPPGS